MLDLKNHKKLIVVGGPKTGKTSLVNGFSDVFHTDTLAHKDWSVASEEGSRQFDKDTFIVEGASAIRALRKWLQSNPLKKLNAKIVFLDKAYEALSERQQAMAKGIKTIWNEIESDAKSRGIEVLKGQFRNGNKEWTF